MSSFDPRKQVRTGTYTVYYAYGHVAKIFPPPDGSYCDNRDIIYGANSIVSDGVEYDLTDKNSIYSIKVPNYDIYAPSKVGEELGVAGCLDYVLRIKSGRYWQEGNFDLAMVCLEKATELMKYSTIGWDQKDFFRIVNELNDLGRFKRAQQWKDWIEQNIPGAASIAAASSAEEQISSERKRHIEQKISECARLETDLIEVGDIGGCCAKCAMYRKRVYSLRGENKLFPRFPKDFHWGCGLSGWPYIYDVSEPSFPCGDVVTYSNRPFVDDRTPKEIEDYKERFDVLNKQSKVIKEPNLNRIIYYKLVHLFPDIVPKTIGGFSRMRSANSKNYQELVERAEAAGFVFPNSLEEVAEWEGEETDFPIKSETGPEIPAQRQAAAPYRVNDPEPAFAFPRTPQSPAKRYDHK